MRIAVLSDIHANAFALQAVQAHAREQGADLWWFLGDATGYGPHPVQVVEFWQSVAPEHWVPGNHDARQVNVLDERTVNDDAEKSHQKNLDMLTARPDLQTWLQRSFPPPEHWIRRQVKDDDLYVLVHGALYRDPKAAEANIRQINRYLPANQKFQADVIPPLHHLLFYLWPWLPSSVFLCELEWLSLLRGDTTGRACVFSGHTHIPQFWYLDGEEEGTAQAVRRRIVYGEPYILTTRPTLVNPGSVGQPRDGDPRAAYALLDCDAGTVTFYRVPYPIEKTKRDMLRQKYPVFLRERLSRAPLPDHCPLGFEL